MKFSNYVVLENTGGSVDPLGFLRPSGALADNLFPQFTVLSNRPAYHGFLAHAFAFLAARKKRPGDAGFSSAFRDLEIFWGIVNGRAEAPILNVTKYAPFVERDEFSLKEAQRHGVLYAKLNYGTLGHYSTPSISWHILSRKGTELTPMGQRLAQAWAQRGKFDFGTAINAWLGNRPVSSINDLASITEYFHLDAAPSGEERKCWQEVIGKYCELHPAVAPLWENPVSREVMALAANEETYAAYYATILEHYRDVPEMRGRVDVARQFELIAALSQFVFEWEYVRRLDEVKKIGLDAPQLEQEAAAMLTAAARTYMASPGARDAGTLFRRLADAVSYDDVATTILSHHTTHQRSKGATPFVNHEAVVVQGRVDPHGFAELLSRLKEDIGAVEMALRWRYRRGWHFDRAVRWLDYAGGVR